MNSMDKKQEVKAVGKYLRISPNKARRILNLIRGRTYQGALMILDIMPHRACEPISQILTSAAANAQNNLDLKKQDLKVKTVFADQGPILKRSRSRAKGRVFQIRKPTCHITIILEALN